jgi:hypothetical protein
MPYEDQCDGKPTGPLQVLSASSAPTNFQAALLQMIESAARNPSQLRQFVYELARANLRREFWKRKPALTAVEVKECMLALETAISRVEADSAGAEYANSSIPRLQIGPTRLESGPMPQLSDMRSADLENGATSPSDSNSDSGKSRGKDSVVVPLDLRESFESLRPDPTISLHPEPPLARANPTGPGREGANIGSVRLETDSVRPEANSMPEDLDMRPPHIEDDAPGDSVSDSDSARIGSVIFPRASPDRSMGRTKAENSDFFGLRPEPMVWRQQLQTAPSVARFKRPQVEIVYPERENSPAVRMRRRAWLWFVAWPIIALAGPAVFLVVYLAFSERFAVPTTQPKAQQQNSSDMAASAPSGLLLPSNYGVYAISNGVLYELQALPIKAPDQRVALSAEIKSPSQTVLPDGKIVFVAFRRELVNSAPQKVTVRVVARIARAMTLSSGKVVSTAPDGVWRVRSNFFDFKVSPLNDNREMVVVRPEAADFAFPAGRYALVFGALAYDFTVAGPITAASQCLEAFEALNGPIFSECRPK